jgi:putative endonuclease
MPRPGGEVAMFTTYILQNNVSYRFYIGSTNNLTRRISEHNRGQTKSTRQNGIWEIKYTKVFASSLEAKRWEIKIKSYKGGNAFKKLIAGVVQW